MSFKLLFGYLSKFQSHQHGSTFIPGVGAQIGFVGATMPRDLQNIIGDLVPVSI